MKPFFSAIVLVFACIPTAHAEDFQKLADATAWKFSQEQAVVADSLLRFSRDYQVELIRPKNKFGDIIVRVVDDGKEVFSVTGNYRTVFRSSGDVVVYADYMPTRTGCTLVAFDLKKQKQLWKTDLKGLGPVAHTGYSNAVNLEIINNEAVRVFGNEAAGQYVEFVDLNTGKTVGHRRYGK